MIQVINGKIDGFIGTDKIYIGRTNHYYGLTESVLHNDFKVNVDGSRDQVLAMYKRKLWLEFNRKGKVYAELVRIAQKVKAGETVQLVCWCKPLACHGDIIKSCIEWMIKEGIV